MPRATLLLAPRLAAISNITVAFPSALARAIASRSCCRSFPSPRFADGDAPAGRASASRQAITMNTPRERLAEYPIESLLV